MSDKQITAEAYIRRLADRGIDYVFANAGTDFAPIIEAISSNAGGDKKIPKFITVPHENVAMAMAHGYYRASGKPSSRQGEVWAEVDRKMAETGSRSDTMVLQKMYDDT